MNKKIIILAIIILLVILAWSPWVTKDYAEQRTIISFESKQEGIMDGCGFNCENCGVSGSSKTLFGYIVRFGYGCGFKMFPGSPSPDHVDKTFVSFLGTVHIFSQSTVNY
jgi:hypothetical protein